MTKALRRGIKTSQIGMRQMVIKLTDTATTPVAEGPDKFAVASIVDNGGTGDFTIIFNKPAANGKDLMLVGFAGPADTHVALTAEAHDRITVQISTLAGVAKDEDVILSVMAHDARYEI